ncbi:MAG: hypothetical protein CUN55_11900 [Phototrophicales bacterium]|nr:MAG: hypothetical protein CUN55_11900 [Phototrophicales bacterium]
MIGKTNLKVFIYEPDVYARYAINSYLAWDRRTRVVGMFESTERLFEWLASHAEIEWPNFVLLGTLHYPTKERLTGLIRRIKETIQNISVLVLSHEADPELALAAYHEGARGLFFRNDVGIPIAWATVWAQAQPFSVSKTVYDNMTSEQRGQFKSLAVLPSRRQYPELTDRIRQAIQLCVVEGMSADLAADEMGVSVHTIRSYIKEGYRILESYDADLEFPTGMSAQERAFMRFTALDEHTDLDDNYQDLAQDEE